MSIPSSNPQAFGWIKSALTESMLQASSSLSEAIETTSPLTLDTVSSNLHQIQGSLKMVELDAASMLAGELEELSDKLAENSAIETDPEAVMILKSGLDSLGNYLAAIENQTARSPLILVDDINRARTVRGLQPVTRYDLFDPPLDLSAVSDIGETLDFPEQKRKLVLVDLRKRFRQALLSWLQKKNPEQSLTSMVEIMTHLQKVSDLEVLKQLWWVAAGFIESIREAGVEIDSDIKSQFAKLDFEMSRMSEGNPAAIASSPPDSLLRQMLFTIGSSSATHQEHENSERTKQIVAQLGLDQWFARAEDPHAEDEFVELVREISKLSGEIDPGIPSQIENYIELYFSGNLDSEQVAKFFAQLDELGETVAKYDVGDFNEFTEAVCESIKRVDPEAVSLVETGADIKIASALLLLRDTLEKPSSVSGVWKQSVQDRTLELKQLVDSDPVHRGSEQQPRLQSETEYHQARSMVIDEIHGNLSRIEHLISSVNFDDIDSDSLEPVRGHLRDLSDWFGIIEADELSRLTRATARKYKQMLAGSISFSKANTERLAFVIASIGVCAGQLEEEGSQPAAVIDRASLMLDAIEPRVELQQQAESDTASSTSSQEQTGYLAMSDAGHPRDDHDEPVLFSDFPDDADIVRDDGMDATVTGEQDIEATGDSELTEADSDAEADKPGTVTDQLDQLDEIRRSLRGGDDEEVQFIRLALLFSAIQDQADAMDDADLSGLAEIGKSLTQRSIDGEINFDSEIEDFVGLISRQMRQQALHPEDSGEQGIEEWQGRYETIISQQQQASVPESTDVQEEQEEQPSVSSAITEPQLRQIFIDELHQQSSALGEVLDSINTRLSNPDDGDEMEIIGDHLAIIERLVHTLTGNFKNLGFSTLGESLEDLETLVKVDTDEVAIVGMYRDNLQILKELMTDTASEIEREHTVSRATAARYQALPGLFENLQREIVRKAIPLDINDVMEDSVETADNPDSEPDYSLESHDYDDSEGQEMEFVVEVTGEPEILVEESGIVHEEQEKEISTSDNLDDDIEDIQGDASYQEQGDSVQPDIHTTTESIESADHDDMGSGSSHLDEEAIPVEPVADDKVVESLDATDETEEAEKLESHRSEGIEEADSFSEFVPVSEEQEIEQDPDDGAVEQIPDSSSGLDASDPVQDEEGHETDDEIRQIFLEESESRLSRINNHLAQWRSSEVSEEILAGIRREFHTLKGSAAASGFGDISRLSHAVESLLEQDDSRITSDDSSLLNLLEEMHDGLAAELGFIPGANEGHINSLISMVEVLISGESTTSAINESDKETEFADQLSSDADDLVSLIATQQEATMDSDVDEDEAPGGEAEGEESESQPGYWMPPTDLVKIGSEMHSADSNIGALRIESKKLSDLLNFSGELGLTRTQLKSTLEATRAELEVLRNSTKRIRDGLRDLEFEADSQMRSLPENRDQETGDELFDPLQLDRYSRLQSRAREVSRQLDDLARVERQLSEKASDLDGALIQQIHLGEQLQDGLMSTRMISISEYLPRLRQLVRETSRRREKPVDFVTEGADIEVDRQVLDTMMPPFEHMIRNAIIHGIESEEERRRQDKSTSGQISLKVVQQGSELLIEFSDDGAGLDREKLSQRAVEIGLVQSTEDSIEDHLLQIITEPGYSTAETVSLDSGRGVGLDVVYQAVRTLGGSMALSSQSGEGVSFQFRLPVTMTVSQALLIRVGTFRFAVLTRTIERVVRVQASDLVQVNGQTRLAVGDQMIPVFNMAERLQESSLSTDESFKSLVLVRFADRIAAFEVDQFEDIVEIVTKVPGSQLTSIEGVIGVTILADSSIVLILDPGQFVDRSAIHSEAFIPFDHSHGTLYQPVDADLSSILQRVLVVDDSLVVRKVMQRDIEGLGLEAVVAVDGVHALEMLEENEVDIALIDLEMPRMNGYELLEKIKTDSRYQDLPTIIITSRSGELHRDRALELGADEYITKPYDLSSLKQMMESIVLAKTVKH
jgi:chemotaxis protein histidine kinase CheA/ActR/RegA family two-component response regulator